MKSKMMKELEVWLGFLQDGVYNYTKEEFESKVRHFRELAQDLCLNSLISNELYAEIDKMLVDYLMKYCY